MTTKAEVISLHREHPDWTSGQIARHLNCHPAYVVATFYRNGLKLPGGSEGRPPYAPPGTRRERERCARIAEFFGQPNIAAAIRRGVELGGPSNEIENKEGV